MSRLFCLTVLLTLGGATGNWAGSNLAITSFAGDTNLVFRTPDNGTSPHHYRVESATSLVSASWSSVRTVGGVGAGVAVTNGVPSTTGAAYYRVVATSNSATFVDGAYMVVDVSEGTNAVSYPVTYYATSAAVPGGITNDAYKTTNILLRFVPAGTFAMGAPTNELGFSATETQHQVTLTQPFYMGVFEVTQKQWERVMGAWPSYFNNVSYRDSRPVEQVSYDAIRGTNEGAHWPASNDVDATSFMGRLRARTGSTFDLPTESQWEYAGRAGTTTALNSGFDITNINSDANMAMVGRYWYNGGSGYASGGNTSVGSAKVGSYAPNAWGLYDIHGNVFEWCLDRYVTYPPATNDPPGALTGSLRMRRGASWNLFPSQCRAGYRNSGSPGNAAFSLGFRIVLQVSLVFRSRVSDVAP